MKKDPFVGPILKWAGGKRQLLDIILPLIPDHTTYYEPFLGGGAILFGLQPQNAVVNDINPELINVYQVIQKNPKELIDLLKGHDTYNDETYFYKVRELDRRLEIYAALTPEERAARTIYLNRTCFSGLFRVNQKGMFNTPWGKYDKPGICNEEAIWAMHKYLRRSGIRILCGNYKQALKYVRQTGFVYFDPPYMPVSSASFTEYTRNGFNEEQQIELKEQCDRLNQRGVRFLLSNSCCPFVEDLYSNYIIERVPAKRAININSRRRGAVEEVLVRNYSV